LPLSDAVRSFLRKRYPDRHDLYIGLDIAVAVGHPSVLSTALLLIPVGVFLCGILPGNLLPLGDLANIWVPIRWLYWPVVGILSEHLLSVFLVLL
jgi:PTS system galactitol-specific IIC component